MPAKRVLSGILVAGGVDALFRLMNRNKLLVLMYHAVTKEDHQPPVWTHLPVGRFQEQLQFLKKHYQVITLDQFLAAAEGRTVLPAKAALITFDDGYRNNYRVAFPVLRELGLPCTIFLTVDRIGCHEPLWLDELYLHLSTPENRRVRLPFPDPAPAALFKAGRVWEAYQGCAEFLKVAGADVRDCYLEALRESSALTDGPRAEDFRLLDWDEVAQMRDSGLVSFGVHTASHRILSELNQAEWDREIAAPREKLERMLGAPQRAFCFPNGRPGIDYRPEHLDYLAQCGYRCSFTTGAGLYRVGEDDPLQVSRIAAGNDLTSEPGFFRLNTSGFTPWLRRRLGKTL